MEAAHLIRDNIALHSTADLLLSRSHISSSWARLSHSPYEGSTRRDGPWRILSITAILLSALCIMASGLALVKLSMKRCQRNQARRRLRMQAAEGQASRMLRLSERAVTAILVLDALGNVVRILFYSRSSGPLMFITGQVEPTNKLGITSFFHFRASFHATVLVYHLILAQILCDWIVSKRSAVNLQKQYRVDGLLLFGGLGALSLFVLMEVLRFYSGLRGLLVGFLLYDGIILPSCLLYMAFALRRIALAIREGALADTFFADRRTRLVTRVLFVLLSCLVLGVFALAMDVLIWLNVWVRQSDTLRLTGSMLALVSWRILSIVDAFVLGGLCEAPALTWLLARIRGPAGAIELAIEEGRASESRPASLNNSQSGIEYRDGCMMAEEVGVQSALPVTPSARREALHIFCSSWNVHGLKCLPHPSKRVLEQWIPRRGYDLYAVAFQNYEDPIDVLDEIKAFLGPAFGMYTVEVEDVATEQELVLLALFYRESDVASGALCIAHDMLYTTAQPASTFPRKAPLPPSTKPSPAAVPDASQPRRALCGVSVRYHDAVLAFVGAQYCHATPTSGKSAPEDGYTDARRMLSGLCMEWDKEMDAHLQHHHTFLLADLKFRSGGVPEEVIHLMSKSARAERDGCWSGQADWRKRSYAAFMRSSGEGQGSRGRQADRAHLAEEVRPIESPRDKLPGAKLPGAPVRLSSSSLAVEITQASLPPPSRDAWWWVPEYDFLLQAVREEQALEGFHEGPIRFPPSSRYHRYGETPADFCDKTRLSAAFAWQGRTIKAADGTLVPTYRTPSYSARVLVHSLPHHAPRLAITGYDVCDSMRGSKHLPISASIDLLVDRSVHGFHTLARPVPVAPPLDSKQVEPETERGSHSPCPGSPVPPVVVELELRSLTFDLLEPRTSVGQVLLLYPLPTEDPLASLRSQAPHIQCHPSTGTGAAAPQGEGGQEKEELQALLKSRTAVSWQQDRSKAHVRLFRTTTLVHPTFSEHAILRLHDARSGQAIGQGVVHVSSLLTCPSSATELTVPLGLGGTPTGSISFEIRVDARPLPPALLPFLPTDPRPPNRLPPVTMPYPVASTALRLGGYSHGGVAERDMGRDAGAEERSGGATVTTSTSPPTQQPQASTEQQEEEGAEPMYRQTTGGGMGEPTVLYAGQ